MTKFTKGMTLVETLIAIAIFTLGTLGFTLLANRTWRFNSFIIEEGNATTEANRAISLISKSLRKVRQADDGNYPIEEVGDFSITVYLNDDDDNLTERVHYFLDGEILKKGVTKPTGSPLAYPSGDTTVTNLAHYITNTPSQPIFFYYNKNYPGDSANNPMINPSVSDIRLVQIHLWVNIKPLVAPENINLSSFVELRNLNETI